MFSCKATQRSTQALGAAQGHVPPKGSLALILPSGAGPLPFTRPRTAMPFGGTCAPSSLLHRDLRGVVLRLHLPEEELDGVLHEAGDGHRTYAARNWGNY